MPETPLTPEEKLLRIIESPAQTVRNRASGRGMPDFRLSWKYFKAQYAGKFGEKAREFLNLKTLNVFLVVAAVAATTFLVLDFPMGMPRSSLLAQIESSAKKMDIGDLTIRGLEPLASYVQEITQRNIFALPEPEPQQPQGKPPAPPSPAVTQLTSDLKLVGVIWSQAPQAMIEDTKEGRTHLVNRGSTLKGARVKDILKDRVILSYDNQDIELR